jgi:hypothetical protein
MSIVVLQLTNVKRKSEARPKKCRYCQGATFQRWGKVRKPVRDSRCRNVQVYRYRCCHCQHTFRYYPQGVDRADHTQRLRKLAALALTHNETVQWWIPRWRAIRRKFMPST